MTSWVRLMRRGAGAVYRQLFPSPEIAAWRNAQDCARVVPRFTPGSIRMLDYELQYSDLLSFCPQWHDIFIDGALEYRSDSAAPRILDCGGNLGLASLFFKRRFPSARITAYEADPALFTTASEYRLQLRRRLISEHGCYALGTSRPRNRSGHLRRVALLLNVFLSPQPP